MRYNNDSATAQIVMCNTLVPAEASALIKPSKLFYSTSDTSIIERMRRVIFEKKESSTLFNDQVDARFVILLKQGDSTWDIIVKDQLHNGLLFNDKYQFSYSFNFMDSIRSILKVTKIDCKSD